MPSESEKTNSSATGKASELGAYIQHQMVIEGRSGSACRMTFSCNNLSPEQNIALWAELNCFLERVRTVVTCVPLGDVSIRDLMRD